MSSHLIKTLSISIAIIIGMAMLATADVPQLINYQGRLIDSEGEPVNDIVGIVFTIYDDSTGGNVKWTESHIAVQVENGLFSVLLGSVNPILDSVFSGSLRYLGIKVDTDPEITPRNRLVSAAYAYRSNRADTAGYAVTGSSDLVNWTVTDSVLYTENKWGLARAGNLVQGSNKYTHVCLGFDCITGNPAADYRYITVCGGSNNVITNEFSTICGGGYNVINSEMGFIGGGRENHIFYGNYSSIAGGYQNTKDTPFGDYAFIGGGQSNRVCNGHSVVCGGFENEARADYSSVLGGTNNVIDYAGDNSAIIGGSNNEVVGKGAVAAGTSAKALHNGSFVWADKRTSATDFETTDTNQFLIRAHNGVGINTNDPQSTLHLGGVAGTDGIVFPDGTKQTTASFFPAGVIVMWSGTLATIPSGWALCDGTNGTPNLTDRFMYGVSSGQNPGPTGGNTTHTHTVDPAAFTSTNNSQFQQVYNNPPVAPVAAGTHSHTIDVPATTSSSSSNLPPYYKLAFIMKL